MRPASVGGRGARIDACPGKVDVIYRVGQDFFGRFAIRLEEMYRLRFFRVRPARSRAFTMLEKRDSWEGGRWGLDVSAS